jgi:hypothetical protein
MSTMGALHEAALARVIRIGANPDDDSETKLRKALLVFIAIAILPVAFVWGVLYVAFAGLIGYTAFLYFFVSLASILLFARNRDDRLFLRIQLVSILLAPTLSSVALGGFLGSGGVGLWGVMAPLGALVFSAGSWRTSSSSSAPGLRGSFWAFRHPFPTGS